jgi:hypothetical protein
MTMEFQGFGKIARLDREIIVTEKIDGTNAQVYITFDDLYPRASLEVARVLTEVGPVSLYAGSRNRWVTVGNDNFGFAAWVQENAVELVALGPGRHFGEWWGKGINRGYGVDGKYFSLFNTRRWAPDYLSLVGTSADLVPTCCKVVPVLYQGKFSQESIERELDRLRSEGSVAAPGFMEPEGVVVYHTASNTLFKKTIGNDGPKGE